MLICEPEWERGSSVIQKRPRDEDEESKDGDDINDGVEPEVRCCGGKP
jgi:hypothetical protein